MNHVQVIDDALNCTYPIYAVTEQEFALLFPAHGQDIEFAEDVAKRLGNVWARSWLLYGRDGSTSRTSSEYMEPFSIITPKTI